MVFPIVVSLLPVNLILSDRNPSEELSLLFLYAVFVGLLTFIVTKSRQWPECATVSHLVLYIIVYLGTIRPVDSLICFWWLELVQWSFCVVVIFLDFSGFSPELFCRLWTLLVEDFIYNPWFNQKFQHRHFGQFCCKSSVYYHCYRKPCTLGSKEFSLAFLVEIAFSTVGFSPEGENHFVPLACSGKRWWWSYMYRQPRASTVAINAICMVGFKHQSVVQIQFFSVGWMNHRQ